MGAAKEHRGNANIRRQIEDEQNARPYERSLRGQLTAAQNKLDMYERTIAQQDAELAKLRRRQKRMNLVLRGRRLQLAALKKALAFAREDALKWFREFRSKETAHRKLSAVVRFGWSSDEYRRNRSEAALAYPHLFGDES